MTSIPRSRTIARLAAVAVVSGMLLAEPGAAHAQIPVLDAASLQQMVLTVQNGMSQLQSLQTQINNQERMLAPLASAGGSTSSMYGLFQQGQQVLVQIQGLLAMGNNLQTNLAGTYPDSYTDSTRAAVLGQYTQMQSAQAQTIQVAMNFSAQVLQNQQQIAQAVNSLVNASNNAQGPTAVGQATNQILANMSQQLSDLQSLLIMMQRSQQQDILAKQARGRANNAFIDNSVTYSTPQSFTGGY